MFRGDERKNKYLTLYNKCFRITLNIEKAMNRNSRSFINFQRAEGWCDSVIVDFELT